MTPANARQALRITFVLPPLNMSGGIRVCAIHADGLRRRGHAVTVVSVPHRDPSLRDRLRAIRRRQPWPRRQPPEPSHFDGLSLEKKILKRWRPVRDRDVPDADVVVATWWETAEWVAALSRSKGAKVCFHQGFEVDYNPHVAGRIEAVWRLPLHKIVVSRWLAELARQRFADAEVSLVPNAVEPRQFHAPPRGRQSVPTVGTVYSRYRLKGTDLALKAYALAAARVPGLRLVCFGAEEPTVELTLPPGATFELLPPQQRIREIYAGCDAWLFSSRSEGFGLPILEAMACRTPIIATPAGAAPELLQDGGGILCKPENPQDLAEAIIRVCNLSDSDWRQLSASAWERATRYTWDDATGLFEAALRRAMETKANR